MTAPIRASGLGKDAWRDISPTNTSLERQITASVDAAVSTAVRRHLEHTDVIGASVYEAVEAFLVSPVGRDTVAGAVEKAITTTTLDRG